MSKKIQLLITSRADRSVSIDCRHNDFVRAMAEIGAPLGFAGLEPPPAPDFRNKLLAGFTVKLPLPELSFSGQYQNREENFEFVDSASFDDAIFYGFTSGNRHLNYAAMLDSDFARVIAAFGAYSARVYYGAYVSAYCGGFLPSDDGESGFDEEGNEVRNNAVYNRLLADESVEVDGRNNIYTLSPAQFWDAELCRRALGYGPDEVIRRLRGTDAKVRPLMDGVYIVFNDNIHMTYDGYLEINNRYKPMLGLV